MTEDFSGLTMIIAGRTQPPRLCQQLVTAETGAKVRASQCLMWSCVRDDSGQLLGHRTEVWVFLFHCVLQRCFVRVFGLGLGLGVQGKRCNVSDGSGSWRIVEGRRFLAKISKAPTNLLEFDSTRPSILSAYTSICID